MTPPEIPSLSDEEQHIIDSMCSDTLFAAWNEDSAVEDINFHLRQLWQTAFRMGLAHGREEAKAVCRKEDHLPRAAVQKKMEQERVWGYDVGWKLCAEVSQDRAQKASIIPPSRSFAVAATQTEAVSDALLDWAVDADTLPTSPPHPPLPTSPPRDFTVLSTGARKPFGSLQRRRRRSPRSPSESCKPLCSIFPQHTKSSGYPHHSPSSFRTSTHSSRSTSGRVPAQLDWDHDPRLRNLGRALATLGWIRV
ncbi:hypothetical protein DFH06DRAFT_373362 [Mycena polygramma]|nr:hypothetical protein DFH06DRAFT_373362 [Mycena polygramma]